jgi:excisionase family DNA binding protein
MALLCSVHKLAGVFAMSAEPANERLAFSVAQAAQAVGLSRFALYDAINDGELTAFAVRKRGKRLILREDLLRWITSRQVPVRTAHG